MKSSISTHYLSCWHNIAQNSMAAQADLALSKNFLKEMEKLKNIFEMRPPFLQKTVKKLNHELNPPGNASTITIGNFVPQSD